MMKALGFYFLTKSEIQNANEKDHKNERHRLKAL